MKKIYLLLFLLSMIIRIQAQDAFIARLPNGITPVIDGTIENFWDTISVHNINKNFYNEQPTVTAYWKAVWNDTALFVLVSVNDDYHCDQWCSGDAEYMSDKTEVYMDVNSILKDGQGSSGYPNGHFQFAPSFQQSIDQYFSYGINWQGYLFSYAYKITGTNYVFEYAIPWSSLKDKDNNLFTAANGSKFGFDINVIDRDSANESRKRAVWMNDGSVNQDYDNMDNAGVVVLANSKPTLSVISPSGTVLKNLTCSLESDSLNTKKESDFILMNEGLQTLNFTLFQISGEGFTIIQPDKNSLALGDTLNLKVFFKSSSPGTYNATVQINSNDATNNITNLMVSINNGTTIRSGTLSGTLKKINSPYLINNDITVPLDSTLTIEPGVKIIFQGYYRINVIGNIKANGSASDSIYFVRDEGGITSLSNINISDGGWHGIIWDNWSGQLNKSDSSIFRYCVFKYSKSINYNDGGAISIRNFSKIRFSFCTFYKNFTNANGGAIDINNDSNIYIYNCSFLENFASNFGGAICYRWGNGPGPKPAQISNSTFFKNTSGNRGGACYLEGVKSHLKIIHCSFDQNQSNQGGALYSEVGTTPLTILNSNFSRNKSTDNGGALYLDFGGVTIQNCIINNNYSGNNAGAIFFYTSDDFIGNCIIANNEAANDGGAFIMSSSSPVFVNNTIVNNKSVAGNSGICSGITFWDFSAAEFYNDIIWGNTNSVGLPRQLNIFQSEELPVLKNCIIQPGPVYAGTKIQENAIFLDTIGSDPAFVTPTASADTNLDASGANWRLKNISPAINKGIKNNQTDKLSSVDFYNQPRIMNGIVDIGAAETHIGAITVKDTIKINTIWTADTIWVTNNIFVKDSVTLTISPGTTVIFDSSYEIKIAGTIKAIGDKEKPIKFTVKDTDGFWDRSNNKGGWLGLDFNNDAVYWNGADGAMSDNDSSYIQHCIFEFAKYTGSQTLGGAINVRFFSRLVISDCNFKNNTGNWGGAICLNNQSSPVIKNNVFYNNHALNEGGAIAIRIKSNPLILNNLISNDTSYIGGGLSFYNSSPTVINNIISHNCAGFGGGVVSHFFGQPVLINNTIIYNYANNAGGGMQGWDEAFNIYNTVFWGNKVQGEYSGNEVSTDGYGDNFYNCNIKDFNIINNFNGKWNDSANIISMDPGFIKTANSQDHSAWLTDYSSQPAKANVKKLTGSKINMDNSLLYDDIWSKIDKNVCNRIYKGEDKFWHGNDDESGYWQAVWTDTGIFIGISVVDDIYYNGSYGQWYTQDRIEMYLNMNAGKPAGPGQNINGRYQILLNNNLNVDFTDINAGKWLFNSENAKAILEHKAGINGNHSELLYISWQSIPDSAGNIFKPDGKSSFGFDLYLVDNDGPNDPDFGGASVDPAIGARTRLVWSNDAKGLGGNENWFNMEDAGIVKCLTDTISNIDTVKNNNDGLHFDYHISALSGNIDKGTSNIPGITFSATDYYGNPRINNNKIDIGAVENQGKKLELTNQPVGGISCNGDSVIFSVAVNDTASYEWQKDGKDVPGAISQSLKLLSISAEKQGNYGCIVKNGYGKISSNTASLQVNNPPAIISQLQSQLVAEGSPITIGALVSGTSPFTNSWTKDSLALSGQTGSSISFTSFGKENAGMYTDTISNLCGSVITSSAGFYLVPQLKLVKKDSTSAICDNDSLKLVVNVDFPATVQFQKNGNNIGSAQSVTLFKSPYSVILDTVQPKALINKVSNPISIDGKINDVEWKYATTYNITKKYKTDEAFKNPNDLAGYWKAAYDNSGLYILVNVTKDDIHYSEGPFGQWWEKDQIEIYLDMNDTLKDGGSPSNNGTGHFQIPFLEKNNPATMPSWCAGCQVAITVDSTLANTSTIEELYIPWKAIPKKDNSIYNPKVEKPFGFDVYLSDNDGPNSNKPPRRRLVWSNIGNINEDWLDMDDAGLVLCKPDNNIITYNINKVAKPDEGNYVCNISSVFGNVSTNGILVSVYSAPSVVAQPSSRWVAAGSSFTVDGGANGTGPMNYVWYKNGNQSETSSSLKIVGFRPIDEGIYFYSVNNSCGSDTSKNAAFYLFPLTSINTKDSVPIVCKGEKFELSINTDYTANFQWQKDGQIIKGATNSVLSIVSVNENNQGNYNCKVSNTYGSITTDPVFLQVRTAPEITDQPASTLITKGDPLSLEVRADGSNPIAYQWQHDGLKLAKDSLFRLKIDSFKLSDEGIYICTINNMCGNISSSPASINLAPQICMVSVGDTTDKSEYGSNVIVWEKESKVKYKSYNIYRESTVAGFYDKIGNVPYNDSSVFEDDLMSLQVNPKSQAFLYKITGVDENNEETDINLCPVSKTIHLVVTKGVMGGIQLQWDQYIGFPYQSYFIYRGINYKEFVNVDVISSSQRAWTDLDTVVEPNDTLTYFVSVRRANGCNIHMSAKKAGGGVYVESVSNLEDNRLKSTGPTLIKKIIDPTELKVTIFPIPVKKISTVRYSLNKSSNVSAILVNIMGQSIAHLKLGYQPAGVNEFYINAEELGLTNGIYYLQINAGEAGTVSKIVVNR